VPRRTGRLVLVSVLLASMAHAAEGFPTALVGEWTTDASAFRDGALHEGLAMYLNANGVGALIAAPPTIGAQGPASYDAKTGILTLRLRERGQPVATCAFLHDVGATTLRAQGGECGQEVYRRRRDHVPEHILPLLK
jgi:hypothetical protein